MLPHHNLEHISLKLAKGRDIRMLEVPVHVGELHWVLLPYYALTNCVAAYGAYQLGEINVLVRLWMVIGLAGGAYGHYKDLTQVLKGDNRLFSDTLQTTKMYHLIGLLLLALPSLLGIYAKAYLYVINVSGWSNESYILFSLTCLTLGWDLYYTIGWGVSFNWHKNHVLAHCVFLLSEYTATGYFASKGIHSYSFFGIQAAVAILLETLLFSPSVAFSTKNKYAKRSENGDNKNTRQGIAAFIFVFGLAFGLDCLIRRMNPHPYIQGQTRSKYK